jgi:tRNA (guanine26-N2/guanine27-N2)-dimethyltransferase
MEEEGIIFETNGLFYNPHMRFNRSFSSLGVGAIKERLGVVDGFCATGIRGIRYGVENENVAHITFIDRSWNCEKVVKRNASSLPIPFSLRIGDFNHEILEIKANFVEIDPFGTPNPFIFPAAYMLSPLRTSYLSITATDVAVLCGSERNACLKKYGSISLNAHFTHEVGLRILLKKIMEFILPLDLSFTVLFSLSKRHYLKVLLKLEKSAKKAQQKAKEVGFVVFCPHCAYQTLLTHSLPQTWKTTPCPNCGKQAMVGGPLYTGQIQDNEFLNKMRAINEKREYTDKKEIDDLLKKMELDNIALYYHPHVIAKIYKCQTPRLDRILLELREKGFLASKTHFNPFCFKTNAPFSEVLSVFVKK